MKSKQLSSSLAPFFRIDPASGLSLQEQIRRSLIGAIETEVFKPGRKLPSSRKLSNQLGVSRNTVSLAYQQLIAEGHLESRERSGVFVASDLAHLRGGISKIIGRSAPADHSIMHRAMVGGALPSEAYRCPPDWQSYRYPFVEGQYDKSLFPTVEWREASRLALAAREVEDWSLDNGETDDQALIEEIRTKLLPRRGIRARPDELLITVGEQQALYLATRLFATERTVVTVEEPGLPELRDLLELRGAHMRHQPVDDGGIIVDKRLAGSQLVCVTPSRQRPTGVTMSMERREELLIKSSQNDFVIIEDDFECELNYLDKSLPALRSLDGGKRVIYVASLSKVVAPGVRLGFMVAPPDVIAAARRLRDLTTRRPSPNNQRAAAFFLSLGHYDSMLRRLNGVFEERLIALRDALNHYRVLSIAVAPVAGGTSFWVRGQEGLNTAALMKEAESRGVLIEPADHFFADRDTPPNMFRMGVTSIRAENIREGVAELAEAMIALDGSPKAERVESGRSLGTDYLSTQEIEKVFTDVTMLYKTVYGVPCTMEFASDGSISGRSGYSNEDRDEGKWWAEDDKWYRQWRNWAYGEVSCYRIQVKGSRIYFVDDEGRNVDEGILRYTHK